MKKFLLLFLLLAISASSFCQEEENTKLHENAKLFMRQGDYANASLILLRLLEHDPSNIAVAKDLAFDYYLQKENDKALNTIKPFLDKNTADDQSFQIAGIVYKAAGDFKEAEKLYKKGIKTFSSSGPIYNDYGELLWSRKDPEAINLWEKGIAEDAQFPGNYYNAARFYYFTKDKIWSLIYGEIFINMESNTSRTAEIKNILVDDYKKLFANTDLLQETKDKNKFELAFLMTMNKQGSVVKNGISAETLTMIRTRFILDWNKDYAQKFPFKLFDLQTRLLTEGLFPVYNQWIFGAAQNLPAYQNWINSHSKEYASFNQYRSDNLFKMPASQYYH